MFIDVLLVSLSLSSLLSSGGQILCVAIAYLGSCLPVRCAVTCVEG